MKETDFYQKHVRKMSGLLHLERIESAVGTGFPDVCAAGGGKQFLIETKVAKPGEGRDWLYFERFQLAFYQKRLRYTNDKGIYIVAACDDLFNVWHAVDILNAPREPYRKWNRIDVKLIAQPLVFISKPWTKIQVLEAANMMINET